MTNLVLSIFAFFVGEVVYWIISRVIRDEVKRLWFFVIGTMVSGALALLIYLGPTSFPSSGSRATTSEPYAAQDPNATKNALPTSADSIPLYVISPTQFYGSFFYFMNVGDTWYMYVSCAGCPDDLQISFNIYRSTRNLLDSNPAWEFVDRTSRSARVTPGYWYRIEADDVPSGISVSSPDPKYCCTE